MTEQVIDPVRVKKDHYCLGILLLNNHRKDRVNHLSKVNNVCQKFLLLVPQEKSEMKSTTAIMVY